MQSSAFKPRISTELFSAAPDASVSWEGTILYELTKYVLVITPLPSLYVNSFVAGLYSK